MRKVLKLDELMALCTTLQNKVLDLQKITTTQRNEIASLKRRVKKLEKKNRSRTHRLQRLYKVSLSTRVESSGDEESLGEDASKRGRRINAIDVDEDITLVSDDDNEMFDVDVLGGEEVFVVRKNENVVEEVVDAAQIDADHQLAARLQGKEQEELSDAEKATLFQQLLEKRRKQFVAKRAKEKRNKPPTKSQQRKIMSNYLKYMKGYKLKDLKLKEFDRIQEMFDGAFKKVNTFKDFRTELVEGKEKRAGEELIQEITKKQKVEDDKEKVELKQLMETILDEEKVAIDVIPLAVKSLRIVDWKIHKEGKKSYYQIVGADGKSQIHGKKKDDIREKTRVGRFTHTRNEKMKTNTLSMCGEGSVYTPREYPRRMGLGGWAGLGFSWA
nr:hypothetical protein [Tanacetum cinerariifolium]